MRGEPITLQQVFNLAWQAFIVEGKPPAIENGQCTYRVSRIGDEDPALRACSKCAIGLALADDQLDILTERCVDDLPVDTIIGMFPQWFQSAEEHWQTSLDSKVDSSLFRRHSGFGFSYSGSIVRDVFRDAQCSLHDYCLDPMDSSKFVSPDSLRRAYIAFANRYKLTIPEESDVNKNNASASV